MATQVQLRGGTTSEHSSFTGAAREVTVDTDKDVVVVHDGSTAGGIPLAKEASVLPLAGGTMTGTIAGFTSTGIDDNATSTAITIDASESVGIGTASPSAYTAVGANKLVVGTNSGNNGITIAGATTGYSSLAFADSAGSGTLDDYVGLVQYSHITNSMNLFTNSLERMRISSAGDVTVGTGNLVIGTSGKGIDFSATSDGSGTMTSEVLDDYEEGTWTPTVDYGTVSVASNYYTKVGNLVTVNALVYTFSDKTTAANIVIGGLPFTPVGEQTGSAMTRYFNAGEGGFVTYITSAGIRVYGLASSGANYDDVQHSQLGASARVYFNITYRVV